MRKLALILATALLAGVIKPVRAAAPAEGDLTFHARPIQDTVLSYEPVWVELEAENTSDTVVPAFPLDLSDPFMSVKVFDSTGRAVVLAHAVEEYLTSPRDTLTAHGHISSIVRLDWPAKPRDSVSQRGYFAPGRYLAVFRRYRPRLVFSVEPHEYLKDSIVFWVVMPQGDELAAMEEYRRAFRERCRAQGEALFNCYRRHPRSRYADDCLEHLLLGYGSLECRNPLLDYPALSRRLVIDYPNHPRVMHAVNLLHSVNERYCPNRGGRRAINEILDSIPTDSRAAQTARRLKKTGSDQWWSKRVGPAW